MQEVLVESSGGSIVVEITEGKPKIIARTIIEGKDSEVKNENGSGFDTLEYDGNRVVAKSKSSGVSESSVIIVGKGNVVISNFLNYNNSLITNDEVWINGKKVNPNSDGETGCSKTTETIVQVPEKDIRTILRNESGETRVEKLRGNVRFSGNSGDIEVGEIIGSLEVDQNSGDLTIGRVEGELDARVKSGNIDIDSVKGSIRIRTNSGSVRIDKLQIENDSNIICNSGSIMVKSIEGATIYVRVRSGNMEKPKSGFTTLEESDEKGQKSSGNSVYIRNGGNVISIGSRNGGEQSLKGYFGKEEPLNSLNLEVNSGSVNIG